MFQIAIIFASYFCCALPPFSLLHTTHTQHSHPSCDFNLTKGKIDEMQYVIKMEIELRKKNIYTQTNRQEDEKNPFFCAPTMCVLLLP